MTMKRYICIFLFLLTVLGVKAQVGNYPYEQVVKAMNCRMMKVTAVLRMKDGQELDSSPVVRFTICYGGETSRYASDDYIYMLGDESGAWERYGCRGFMDMPTKVIQTIEPVDGMMKAQNNFYGEDWAFSMLSSDYQSNMDKSYPVVMVMKRGGEETYDAYKVLSCDFYDISTGQERLVLKGYQPSKDDYSAGNLFRVFMDRMYEYYR